MKGAQHVKQNTMPKSVIWLVDQMDIQYSSHVLKPWKPSNHRALNDLHVVQERNLNDSFFP